MSVSHDEAHLYLLAKKRDGAWDLSEEQLDVGFGTLPGVPDPSDPRFDSLADWYAEGDVLEVRIPWTMLGYTDPSSLRVWDYPYEADGIEAVKNENLRVYPAMRHEGESEPVDLRPLTYSWEGWDVPLYHERKKKSYEPISEAFKTYDEVVAPPQ